ncbi:hypothetical protein DSO57_1017828 [Entomophthora muscae]|uniref:Uncharacterized protein n=1 Tax=Entomophthora muscae TaxID=34485 RepID=A0ACC2SHB8_9FUNG|nr:hypothetical protein DSO57_1017828 [Entomophthora muscae]
MPSGLFDRLYSAEGRRRWFMKKLAVVLGIGAAAAITRVGLATTGEVHGVIALGLGQVWTGEGSFSFWNKLAFDTLYQSEDELIGLFQLPPARTRLLKNNKSYHFSGPQQLGMPVKCPERQKCITSWETGTNWTIGTTHTSPQRPSLT